MFDTKDIPDLFNSAVSDKSKRRGRIGQRKECFLHPYIFLEIFVIFSDFHFSTTFSFPSFFIQIKYLNFNLVTTA